MSVASPGVFGPSSNLFDGSLVLAFNPEVVSGSQQDGKVYFVANSSSSDCGLRLNNGPVALSVPSCAASDGFVDYPYFASTLNGSRGRLTMSNAVLGFNPTLGVLRAQGIVAATAALATSATDNFLYIPTCAGTPTGTPTTQTGTSPFLYDTTNDKLYIYSGGWKGGTTPLAFI